MLDVPVVTREVGTSSPLFEHGGLLRDDVFGYAGSVDRRDEPACPARVSRRSTSHASRLAKGA